MKCKKIIAGLLMGTMVASLLVGCGQSNATDSGEKQDNQNDNKKVIKVGMEVSYPPFEYYEEDGTTITGIDHDLSVAICDELGYKVEFVPVAWDGIFAGLDKGDYDVIMSAVTITPERTEKYAFTTPYIENYQCLVTMKDAKVKPKKIEELKDLKVGYQEETTSDLYLTDYIEAGKVKCKTNEYSKMMDTFSDLKTGRLDAIICDSTVADQYVAEGSYEITWKQSDSPEQFAGCFKKDSKLIEEFNKALKKLKDNGKLDKILSNYL